MRDFLKTQELYVNGLYILRKLIPKYLCPENLILSAIVADMVHQVISSYAIPWDILQPQRMEKDCIRYLLTYGL